MINNKFSQAVDLLHQAAIKEKQSNEFLADVCQKLLTDKQTIQEELQKAYVGKYMRVKFTVSDDIYAYIKVDFIEVNISKDSAYVVVTGPSVCNLDNSIDFHLSLSRFIEIVNFNDLCQIVDNEEVIKFIDELFGKAKEMFQQ